ncbi:MAG: hypothetical protein JEY79_14045 [Pseudodesulfovibrio sp.]|nr:hypothetical protein [Pseudodesulfovibrio sp.]
MDFLEPLGKYAVIFLCFGLTVFLIKRDLGQIMKRMDCFESSQHACQLENAKEYATRDQLQRVDEKCDRNAEDIARLQGKV